MYCAVFRSCSCHVLRCFQILQLYSALRLRQGILLTGVAASGKSTMYRILSEALTKLHSHHDDDNDSELKQTKTLVFHSTQKLKVRHSSSRSRTPVPTLLCRTCH